MLTNWLFFAYVNLKIAFILILIKLMPLGFVGVVGAKRHGC